MLAAGTTSTAVTATVTGAGSGVTLTAGSRPTVGGTFSSVSGTASGNTWTFSGVGLVAGDNLLRVTASGGSCTADERVTVTVATTTQTDGGSDGGTDGGNMDAGLRVNGFAFQGDIAPLGTLNSIELPLDGGVPTAVVTVAGNMGSCTVSISSGMPPMVVGGPVAVVGSTATVPLTLSDATMGSYTLVATVTCGTATATRTTTLTIDRVAPTCALNEPNQIVIGPSDDADLTADGGFQLRTLATSSGAATIEIKLAGGATPQTSGALVPTNDMVSRDFTILATGTTAYTVTVESKDLAGNICTATRSVPTDFVAPTVTMTSPVDGGTFTTFQIPVSALTTGAQPVIVGEQPGTVTFTTRLDSSDAGPTQIGFASVDVNNVADGGTVTFGLGPQTVTATVADFAGNRASVSHHIIVSPPVTICSLTFTRPASNPALITAAQISGGSYNVQVQSSCNNEPLTLKVNGGAGVVVNTNATGVATWPVPVSNGNYVFRVEVGSGPTANFAVTNATVNTTAPNITQPVPGAQPTLVNAAQDTNRSVAGAQRPLTFTATVPAGGRVDLCSDQTPAPVGSTPCPNGAAGWWVLGSNVVSPENTQTFPDGTYQIRIVVVSAANMAVDESAAVSLFVDTILPSITAAVVFPQEMGTPDKKLNIAELNGQPPRMTFTTSEPIVSVQVNLATGSPAFNSILNVSGTAHTVLLDTGITATELDYNWTITVRDAASNFNVISGGTAADPLNTFALLNGYRIDKLPPVCTVLNATGLRGLADDDDMVTAGFQLNARVSTAADAATVLFSLTGTSSATMTATASNSAASQMFTVAAGTYSIGATCTDSSGNPNAATTVTNIGVDLTPPTCTITAPTGPQTAFTVPTSVTVADPDMAGRSISIVSSLAPLVPLGPLTVTGGTAAGNVTYQSGSQTLTASGTDPAGNACVSNMVSINVNAMGCDIAFTSPTFTGSTGKVYINRAADSTPATPTTADFSVTGHSSCNMTQTVTLFDITVLPRVSLGSAMVDASGNVLLSGLLPEGGPYKLQLEINNGTGILTQVELSPVYVDLTPPTVAAVTPTGTNLKFVAPGNPSIGMAGFIVDATPGGNADFDATATTIAGAVGGRMRVLYQGTQVSTLDITTNPQSVAGLATTLTHNTTGTFRIEITDEAGNAVLPTDTTAVVDVIAPDAPTVNTPLIGNAYTATVTLGWSAVGDDGASGTVDGYDVRWTTPSVTLGNNLASSTDYFDSTHAAQATVAPAGQLSATVRVPPFNTYYFAVRARDEVGNYSAFTAPVSLANPGTIETLTNPTNTASQTFGNTVAAGGSIDGDAFDDLVVTNTSANALYVYFGANPFTTQAACAAVGTATATSACQTITNPAGGADAVGSEVAIANFGESAARDIAFSSLGYSATPYFGRTFIVFGGARPIVTTNFVEIRGEVSGAAFGRPFAIPDFTGDGRAELAISAVTENANRGVVYIFKGRDKAAWDLLRDGADTFVKASKADFFVDGPTPVGTNGNNFGQTRGVTAAGVQADGGVAFTLPASADRVNQVFVMSGPGLAPAPARNSVGSLPATLQTLTYAPSSPGGVSTGFGQAANGLFNVNTVAANDLVITEARNNHLFVFNDGSSAAWPVTPSTTITGANSFGNALALGDFSRDGANDMICTESSVAPAAWALFPDAPGHFESTVGAAFWFSKLYTGVSATARGLSTVSGDFDNDGNRDFVVGDRLAPPGKVFVWH